MAIHRFKEHHVKTGILRNYPNFENIVAKFSIFTKKCLLFSCDFDQIFDSIKRSPVDKMRLEGDVIEDIRSDIERAERVDRIWILLIG